jgi:apolipoprotein N-acyltransferase
MKTRNILLLISLLLTLTFGYKLNLLNESKQLWGYWSFGFLISLYCLLIAIFYKIDDNSVKNRLKYIVLSGIFFGLGFPNSPLTPFMFVGFVPLLILFGDERNRIAVFKDAFFAFLLWNTISTWWVSNASLAGGFMANYLNSVLMALPFLLYYKINKSNKYPIFLLAALWIGFEMLHLRWDMSWPWLTLGNSFAEYPSWVQWYEYTGVMGGSIWIWIINILIYNIYKNRTTSKIVALASVIGLPIVISLIIPIGYIITLKPRTVEVLTIQPNFEPFFEKFDLPESLQVDTTLALVSRNITENTKFVILPETVFSGLQLNTASTNVELRRMVDFMRDKPNTVLLTGVDAYKLMNSKNEGNAVRTYNKGNGPIYLEAYNSCTSISSKDSIENLVYYKKSKLVPGPEILPFKFIFRLIAPVFDKLGGTIEGLGTQSERTVFSNDNLKIAPVICYESIYGDFMRGYIHNGAQAIAVMTNDGWWDDSPGYLQHMKFSKLRAIEFRRPVVRSANTGISCFINHLGEVEVQSKYNERIGIKHDMFFSNRITFYTQYGDWIGWLVIGLGVIIFFKGMIVKP